MLRSPRPMKRLLSQFPIPIRGVLQVARLTPFDTATAEGRSLERYRRIVLSILTSIVSRFVTTIVSLAMVPIALGYLGKEQYGLWAAINAFVPWVALFDLGLVAGLVNPIAEAHGRDDRTAARTCFSTAFTVLLAIAAVLGVAALVGLPRASSLDLFPVPSGLTAGAARATLVVALGLFLAAMPLNTVPQVYAGYQRAYVATSFTAVAAVFSLGLFIVAVQTRASLPAVVGAANSAALMAGGMSLAFLWLRDMTWLRPRRRDVSTPALRRLLATSVPLYLFQIGSLLVNQTQHLILARRAGLATVAEYDILFKIYVLTIGLITLSTSSFAPTFREAFERNELGWMRRSFWHLVRLRMLVASAACLAILALGNPLMRLWLGRTDFQQSPGVWLTICGLILVATWASSFGEMLTVLDRIWAQVGVVLLQGVATVALTWILGRRLGVLGALVALTVPAAALTGWIMPRLARKLLAGPAESPTQPPAAPSRT